MDRRPRWRDAQTLRFQHVIIGGTQAQGMQTASQQGADLIVRLNPFSVVLTTLGAPRGLAGAAGGNGPEPVVLGSADGQHEVRAGCMPIA